MIFKEHLLHCCTYISSHSERCRAVLYVSCMSGQSLFVSSSSKLSLKSVAVSSSGGPMNCGSVFWQVCFRPAFHIGGDSWSCVAHCRSSPPLRLMLITPEKATKSNYNFLVFGVEFAQWLQNKHQSKSLGWIREAVSYLHLHVLAVHCVSCSFSSAMAKPNSCTLFWVLRQLPCSATSVLLHLRVLDPAFHSFVLFVLDCQGRDKLGSHWLDG